MDSKRQFEPGSQVYDDGTNVGIGTDIPQAKLDVNGNIQIQPGNMIGNYLNNEYFTDYGNIIGNYSLGWHNDSWCEQPTAYLSSYGGIKLFTGFHSRLSIDVNGNVGIGTTSPQAMLDVNGNISMTDGNQGAGNVLTSDANGIGSWQSPSTGFWSKSSNNIYNNNNGNVGIGTTGPLSKLDVNGGMAVGYYAGYNAAPVSGMIIAGSVGIGTPSPAHMLDVNGNVHIGNATLNSNALYLLGMGNSNANSYFNLGQDATNNFEFGWNYNATPASASRTNGDIWL